MSGGGGGGGGGAILGGDILSSYNGTSCILNAPILESTTLNALNEIWVVCIGCWK